MPPFALPIIQAVAAAIAADSLRARWRRFVPPPAPPPFAQSGGWAGWSSRPPVAGLGRAYPLTPPSPNGDRRR